MKHKFFKLLSLMVLLSMLVACGGQPSDGDIQTAIAKTAAPTASPTLSGDDACNGKVGFTEDGKWECPGISWKPTTASVAACKSADKPKEVWVDGADGEPYSVKCTVVLANAPTVPATQTPSPTVTFTPTPIKPTVTVTYTPAAKATATVVVASDEKTVRDAIIAGCELGAPSVVVGAVTIECGGKTLPAPASYSTAPANATTDLSVATGEGCMTNQELVDAHGWGANYVKPVKDGENVPWEGCGKWVTNANGVGVYWQPFLDNFEYTVTDAKGIVSVNYGPHKGMWVYGATIRQLKTFTSDDQAWVHNDLTLMAREFNYGFKQDPRYGTVPGKNLNGHWVQPDLDATCPTNTVMAAAILGGDDPKFWTAPDWERGAWVFNSKGDGFHHLTHPGEGYFDVWTATDGAIAVYAEDAEIFERLNFEEASFTCST